MTKAEVHNNDSYNRMAVFRRIQEMGVEQQRARFDQCQQCVVQTCIQDWFYWHDRFRLSWTTFMSWVAKNFVYNM